MKQMHAVSKSRGRITTRACPGAPAGAVNDDSDVIDQTSDEEDADDGDAAAADKGGKSVSVAVPPLLGSVGRLPSAVPAKTFAPLNGDPPLQSIQLLI